MIEKRRTTGPRIGPRLTAPQPAPPPSVVQLGSDRVLVGAREVDIAQLTPDPDQPRKSMRPDRLAELADSILAHGLLQPIVVRQEGLAPDGDMRYVVVAGGRRYAALRLLLDRPLDDAARARVGRVRVIVHESDAGERRVLQLIENLQREDLSPVEEARSLKEIMHVEGLTTTALASRVHRSQGYIDERLRLLRYEEIEAAVEAGWLTKSAGAAIASIASADARQSWLARASGGESIRPREVYASKMHPHQRTPPVFSVDPASLPNFGNATVSLSGAVEPALPKFGKGEPSLPDATEMGLPNFSNHALPDPVPASGEDDALTTLAALRVHLAALPLPPNPAGRARLTAELDATLAVVERLLMAIRDDSTGRP